MVGITMTVDPPYADFARVLDGGGSQVVWTRLIDDLETPVSAYLKIARGRPYAFLFESVEGGAWRGRYSVVALEPDLVWRCKGRPGQHRGRRRHRRGRLPRPGRRRPGLPARPRRGVQARHPRRPAAHGRRPVRRHRLRHGPAGGAPARHAARPPEPARRGDDPAGRGGHLRRHRPGDRPGHHRPTLGDRRRRGPRRRDMRASKRSIADLAKPIVAATPTQPTTCRRLR